MTNHFLRWWNRIPLRVQGIVLTAVPFIAVLISSGFALWGNNQRQNAEIDVIRKFEMVSDLNELLTLTVNAETGIRGFLLTRRPEFLEPYKQARVRLPKQLIELDELAKAEPGLKPRIDKIGRVTRMRSLVNEQVKLLNTLQHQVGKTELYPLLARSKTVEDDLRTEVRGMRSEESRLLSERLEEIRGVRSRDYLAIYATLVIGVLSRIIAGWMFNAGIGNRIRQLCENVQHIGRGEELPHEPTGKPYALGDFERELATVANSRNLQ